MDLEKMIKEKNMPFLNFLNSNNERFPEVDWYCDGCGEYLNDQYGFDDHKYVWKCTECGFKSSISQDNILD